MITAGKPRRESGPGGLLRERHGARGQRGGAAGGLSELLRRLPGGGRAPRRRAEADPEHAVDLPGPAGPRARGPGGVPGRPRCSRLHRPDQVDRGAGHRHRRAGLQGPGAFCSPLAAAPRGLCEPGEGLPVPRASLSFLLRAAERLREAPAHQAEEPPAAGQTLYVRARSPRAALPPLYALELLTIYAWEMGTQENESFRLDEGLTTVMELLQEYESLCIYWTKYYTFQNPIIEDVVRKQLQRQRPIILDPADPTYNVAEGCRWDIVAQRACQCLKQDCCYDSKDNPVPSWNVKRARDIQVTVEQWGCPDWTLMVNPYSSIKKVKEKIQRRQSCEGLQRLSFQTPSGERKLLRSRSSLAEFGIFSDTRICLLETIPPEIQVFVRNPEGGSHAYAVDPNSLVLGLKQQIEDKQGLLRKQQELQFLGQVLQDWSVLGSYGIKDSDTLILSKKKDTHFPFLPS
ncbi:2'-5'-oligoadenylate synthase-like protein isoform X3 [Myotis myotis]|uniref:2'-5'-oligoadenylate synthase-like protein isoform X3 n=1 Tax=Myotis myotis TaxID=51298 RepID=UPI0017487707|nr:2'-5'-oligoadenylate synthase-like protein isoform X3 [Myotis myotis]